jgi:hypothetical protein
MHQPFYTVGVKLTASLSAVYATIAALFNYHAYNTIGTALVHVPLALFGAYSAFVTLPINKRFSALAALFAALNAGLI